MELAADESRMRNIDACLCTELLQQNCKQILIFIDSDIVFRQLELISSPT